MNLAILTVPNPILQKKSKPVNKIDAKIKKLVKEMTIFLEKGEEKEGLKGKVRGVGLAAPQIGQLLRIIIIWSKPSHRYLRMINPKIVWHSKRSRLGVPEGIPYEGCLSVPGIWGKVRRYSVIKVFYLTPWGQKVVRRFRKLTGIIIQHEIDHLDGILFTDRIIQQKGQLIKQ